VKEGIYMVRKNRVRDVKISGETKQRIEEYRDYFESEMAEMSRHLREFKANKEEFYRRWSAYSDFNKVQNFLG